MKVYIAQVLGLGDREDAFYNIGAYSTRKLAEKALKDMEEEIDDGELETEIEVYTIDK